MKKILLNILTHGNEFVGNKVADVIRSKYLDIIGKGLDIQVANPKANEAKKRFIDMDLNRVFPGNPDGAYEEKRAFELTPIISQYELVIDVHSTESGSEDIVIVTKLDDLTQMILDYVAPKYVLHMNVNSSSALISSAKIGIAFEMGKDVDNTTLDKTVTGIESVLSYFGLISEVKKLGFSTKYFEVFTQFSKPYGATLVSGIYNFCLVKKGDNYAQLSDGSFVVAEFDFYPILFGNSTYETIFGFGARKIK